MTTQEAEKLASAVLRISDALSSLSKSAMRSEEVLVALLLQMPGTRKIPKANLELVVRNLAELKKHYFVDETLAMKNLKQ